VGLFQGPTRGYGEKPDSSGEQFEEKTEKVEKTVTQQYGIGKKDLFKHKD